MEPYTITFNNLTMGGSGDYGLVQVQGLLDLPDMTSADRARLRRHGLTPGDDFLNGRSVVVTLELVADVIEDFDALIDGLLRATAPGAPESAWEFNLPGVAGGYDGVIFARARRRQIPIREDFFYGIPTAAIEFFATDPRVYSAALNSESVSLASAGGGLNFPVTFPVSFGAVAVGGTINANNSGSFEASPWFRITGPCSNPSIENVTTGQVMSLNIVLAAGEFLDVDVETRTILLGGTASRYSARTSTFEWWTCAPGVSEIKFRASTGTAATLLMQWRSAWV